MDLSRTRTSDQTFVACESRKSDGGMFGYKTKDVNRGQGQGHAHAHKCVVVDLPSLAHAVLHFHAGPGSPCEKYAGVVLAAGARNSLSPPNHQSLAAEMRRLIRPCARLAIVVTILSQPGPTLSYSSKLINHLPKLCCEAYRRSLLGRSDDHKA